MEWSGFEGALSALAGSALTLIFTALFEERKAAREVSLEDKRAKREHLNWKRGAKYASYKDFCSYARRWNKIKPTEATQSLDALRDKVADIYLLANDRKLKQSCSDFIDILDDMKRIEQTLVPLLQQGDEGDKSKEQLTEWGKKYNHALKLSKTLTDLLSDDINEY